MLLDNERKFLFTHIPKTAGTSIRSMLCDLTDLPKPYSELDNRKHQGVSELRESIDNIDEYYKFAFVRNPYERMLSFWSYYRQGENGGKFNHVPKSKVREAAKELGFDKWITFLKTKRFTNMGSHPPKRLPMWRKPQVDFLCEDISFVGRYENLDEDWRTLCDNLNLNYKPLNHFNKSSHTDYKDYYSVESYNTISWWFKRDLDELEYEF